MSQLNLNRVRLLPNAITLLSLAAGLSGFYRALQGSYKEAILLFFLAAIFDTMDGATARLLKSSSELGAQLDSLSDMVAFGVSPALTLYMWKIQQESFGWSAILVFISCMALRLARFNALLGVEDPRPFARYFFIGVPAPAGAGMLLLPLVSHEVFGIGWWSNQAFLIIWTISCGLLLVSRLPTISLKKITVPSSMIPFGLLAIIVISASTFNDPLMTLWAALTFYLVLIPISSIAYLWMARHSERWEGPDETEDEW